MNNEMIRTERETLIRKMSGICEVVEAHEIREDGLWFPRWALSVQIRVEAAEAQPAAVVGFTLDCPRFDEPLTECCTGMGQDRQQALDSALGSFLFGMMSAVFTLMRNESVMQLTTQYGQKERKWNLVQSDVSGLGQPLPGEHQADFWNLIRKDLNRMLGSRKLTVIRLYGLHQEDGTSVAECRINGVISPTLTQRLQDYVSTWPVSGFCCRKQFFFLEQDPATAAVYPYNKDEIKEATVKAIRLFQACDSPEKLQRYTEILSRDLKDPSLAEQLTLFLPEICAENALDPLKLTENVQFIHPEGSTEEVTWHQLTAWAWMKEALYEGFQNQEFDNDTYRHLVSRSMLYDRVRQSGKPAAELEPILLTFHASANQPLI